MSLPGWRNQLRVQVVGPDELGECIGQLEEGQVRQMDLDLRLLLPQLSQLFEKRHRVFRLGLQSFVEKSSSPSGRVHASLSGLNIKPLEVEIRNLECESLAHSFAR